MTAVIFHGKFKRFVVVVVVVTIIYTKGIEKSGLTGKGEEQTNSTKERQTWGTNVTTKQLFVLILFSPSTEGGGESAMQRKREGGHARIVGGDPLGEEAMGGGR